MMPHDISHTDGSLPDEIRRQFGSPAMMRFVRSLPVLGEPPDTDDQFSALLSALERAEAQATGYRGRT